MPRFHARILSPGHRSGWLLPVAAGLIAVLIDLGGEPVGLALRYERDPLGAGQLWRLLTAHVTHLGHSHTILNVTALGVLTLLFAPVLRAVDWLIITLACVLLIDAGLYWLYPSIHWYAGLSGLLHGYWAAGCLICLSQGNRTVLPLLVLLLGKLIYEFLGGSIPMTGSLSDGSVVTQAHLLGSLGGLLGWLLVLATRSRQRPL